MMSVLPPNRGARGGGAGRWGRGRWMRGHNGGGRGRGSGASAGGSSAGGGGVALYSTTAERGAAFARERDRAPARPSGDRGGASAGIAPPIPYAGWSLYFPKEEYDENSRLLKHVRAFEKYFLSWQDAYDLDAIEMRGCVHLDVNELLADDTIQKTLPDLREELTDTPDLAIQCLGLALHQVLTSQSRREGGGDEPDVEDAEDGDSCGGDVLPIVHVRLVGFSPLVPLKQLKSNYYGKFVALRGTVVRVGNIKPLCTKMAFKCQTCLSVFTVAFPDGKFTPPSSCCETSCRSKTFVPQLASNMSTTVDWQTISVQELMDDSRESGRIPRSVDCELTWDLVDTCVPGDIVTVCGTVKVSNNEHGQKRGGKDKCMFLLYIHVNSLVNTKSSGRGTAAGTRGSKADAADFTVKELYAVQAIHDEPQLLRLLVQSLCPSIFGHELVKAGLILGLFGGSQKYANSSNHVPIRGDPHILIVGDPGLGKSQMLQAAANVAPRSVYVCGNTTTTSGLTVTLNREGGSGDFGLEAGALVLADQGVCCIDEFDKMGQQHQALLEAMEQQSVSIAKAGIVCSLPARASVLAAANPVSGHYNKTRTVSENLKMSSALLSRFDLVFILLDKPDEEMDNLLSEHVMALHGASRTKPPPPRSANTSVSLSSGSQLWKDEMRLSEKLKVPPNEHIDIIPPLLLRKYIAYARKYVHPKISAEAARILQEFYVELRKQHHTADSTPITTRQLESLIRLTEARARLELREECTEHDARDIVEIMRFSMVDTFSDGFGALDFQRSQNGSGISGRSRAKKLIAALQATYEASSKNMFTIQEMKAIAERSGVSTSNFEELVSSLNTQGFLLMRAAKTYQLQTAGY